MAVVLETTLGDITIDLFTAERPTTTKNFLKLCKMKYYNFCLFHSVQSNFIAQTGDPTGTGNGGTSIFGLINGPEYKYYEGEKLPKIRHDVSGLVSMVNCGDNMLGSQFFITIGSKLNSLDEHVVFGEVTEGREILLKLNETICDQQHRPYQDIRITHTVVLEDLFDDIPGMIPPDRSPEPKAEMFANSRIGADEAIDDNAGCTAKEIEELKAQQEATAQATILEIVGDIPDKDIAPPENVLFVCKLNPVTTDDDLDIIFSRFGVIKSCEVIRDKVTNDSLQYAFIEFADQKSCEEAYLKMDNVLIDDRRIHVDFSQSVAKIRWKGKGRGIEYLDNKRNVEKFKSEKGSSANRYSDNNRINKDSDSEKFDRRRKENHHEEYERDRRMFDSKNKDKKTYKSIRRDNDDDDDRSRTKKSDRSKRTTEKYKSHKHDRHKHDSFNDDRYEGKSTHHHSHRHRREVEEEKNSSRHKKHHHRRTS